MNTANRIVAFILSAACGACFALPHNLDLPHKCIETSGLSELEKTKKLELETKTLPVVKQVMQETGALAESFGLGYGGRIIMNCGIGYSDYDSADNLAKGDKPSQLEPNMPMRALSVSKVIARAAIWKLCHQGLLNCEENAVLASGITPYNNISQPWHAQCKVSDLAKTTYTTCDISYAGVDEISISSNTGWSLPISFEKKLSYDLSAGLPSGGFAYVSNLAYTLLGQIVKNKTGRNYYDWVRENITRPADVADYQIQEVLGALQTFDSKGVVLRGREPGEPNYDSRDQSTDKVDIGKSLYDGVKSVHVSEAAVLESEGAAAGIVGTAEAWLKIGMYYDVNGVPFITNLAPAGEVQLGENTGTSSILVQSVAGWAAYVNLNRYSLTNNSPPALTTFSRLTKVFNQLNGKDFTYDLAKVSSVATEGARSYQYNKAGTLRYFMANPTDVATLDAAIASVPDSGFTRVGASWRMWQVGASGTVPIYRYFCPQWSTHFYGSYGDAKTIQMIYPNADRYSDTCHFEALKLAAVPLNAAGDCIAPLVPLYRAFRSVAGAPNHHYSINPNDFNIAAGYVSEGRTFCVAQGS